MIQLQSQASFGLVASRPSKIHAKRELLIQINAVSRRLGAAAGVIGMLGVSKPTSRYTSPL
jgi:hypothetical protein